MAMPLKSRQHFIPGGWMFYQPETNWQSNPNVGFNDVVAAIIEHRRANPRFNLSTDTETVARELEAYSEARLRSQYGDEANDYLIGGGAPPVPTSPRLRQRAPGGAVADVAGKAKRISAGIGLMIEWLGSGLKPTDQVTAERRAATCVACPQNRKAGIVERATTNLVADGLHKLMEEKSEMKLATPFDDRLHTCAVCDCVLALKVFVPIEHVRAHTDAALLAQFPSNCWVKHELT